MSDNTITLQQILQLYDNTDEPMQIRLRHIDKTLIDDYMLDDLLNNQQYMSMLHLPVTMLNNVAYNIIEIFVG